eukprot:TRINITY_DN4795_c0_g2_i2.p1 TRINITY_DN4795_c0_g2~~TRINITY_DN4795_c0_g2_i2.p1  ORF type:complete len:222 (+),score=20.91 TRINITY_DN4795_c0_g2_i2:86-751(+)
MANKLSNLMCKMEEEKYLSPKPGKKIGYLNSSRSIFDDDDLETKTRCGDNIEEEISPLPSLRIRSKLFSVESTTPEDNNWNSVQSFSDPRLYSSPSLLLQTETNLDHPEVNTISIQTVNELLIQNDMENNILIIDCRFPYEYDAGHIKGAVNIYLPTQLQTLLFELGELLCMDNFIKFLKEHGGVPSMSHIEAHLQNLSDSKSEPIIILHCEFSQSRSPKL